MGALQDSDPPTALTGPLQFLFGLLVQSCLQRNQLPLLPIYPALLPCLTFLLHMSGVRTGIQFLSVEQ